jgi:hypothetical protein
MSFIQPPIYFENPSIQGEINISVILFDAAPVQCYLKDHPHRYNKDGVSDLVYERYPLTAPLRIITAIYVGNCMVAISTYVILERRDGMVDIQDVLSINKTALRQVSSIRFTTCEAAGRFMHSSALGYHCGIAVRFGLRFLQPPRYSGIFYPFHYSIVPGETPNMPPVFGNPRVNIFGEGWTGNYPTAALDGRPDPSIPVSPFVCRPITNASDDTELFQSMTSIISHIDNICPGDVQDNVITRIPWYRLPFITTG